MRSLNFDGTCLDFTLDGYRDTEPQHRKGTGDDGRHNNESQTKTDLFRDLPLPPEVGEVGLHPMGIIGVDAQGMKGFANGLAGRLARSLPHQAADLFFGQCFLSIVAGSISPIKLAHCIY